MTPTPPRKAKGIVCSSELRLWAMRQAYRLGPDAAARGMGISRHALADVCAGFAVWPTVEARVEAARDESFGRRHAA